MSERWNDNLGHSRQAADEGDYTLGRMRRRLPGDALIERDFGLRLADDVPFRHRLRSIVLGERSAGEFNRRPR
jgi:hypothetical protein